MKLLTLLTLTLLLFSCTKTTTKEKQSKKAPPKTPQTMGPMKAAGKVTRPKPSPMELAHSKVPLAKAPVPELLKALPQLGVRCGTGST